MLVKVFPNFVRNMKEELANLQADQEPSGYESYYRRANHYGYQPWIMRPYVRALVAKAGLAKGATILDLGCGQGMFTALLREEGMAALGIDLSPQAIASARASYGEFFTLGDGTTLRGVSFDAVFVRSCSSYNVENFALDHSVTDKFMSYLKPSGVLLWAYASRAEGVSSPWLQHSLKEVRTHFARYPGAQVYFSLRLETFLLGRWAFSAPITELAWAFSRLFGMGGDLIALVIKN